MSIHDVMPASLGNVECILNALPALPPSAVTLLVVPGAGWSTTALRGLKQLAARGYPLAGHGWRHSCTAPRTLFHRLHAALISRNAAEHLTLSASQIAALMRRCFHWFRQNRLAPPVLYVPPAWAVGPIPRARLQQAPFRLFESLQGILDTRTARFSRLPLVGFEADTETRTRALRQFNRLNLRCARVHGRPLRIAVHPQDLQLKMADDLYRLLDRKWHFTTYPESLRNV